MKNKIKIILFILVLIILVITLSIIFTNKGTKSKDYDEINEKIESMNNINDIENSDIMELWESNIIGTLEIPSLNLKLSVADDIDDTTLENYIGHFPSTALYEGNVGMAGHNSSKFFATLKNIKKGDEIIYNFLFGEKTYIVDTISEIQEDDWSYLEDTEDNRLTLITCVKNQPMIRLCIQAKEAK